MSGLSGKRILIVEDDFLISQTLADIFTSVGALVVGPASTRDAGLALAKTEPLEGAVLDINLRGLRSDIIADELRRRCIPFIFATGYGDQMQLAGVPVVAKPYTADAILQALESVIEQANTTRGGSNGD